MTKVFGSVGEFYDEARVQVSVEKLHYVRGNLVGLGVNLRKNTAPNSVGMENMDAKMETEILHRWAGKALVERDRQV